MQRGEKKLRALLNAFRGKCKKETEKKNQKIKDIIIIIALKESKNYGTG